MKKPSGPRSDEPGQSLVNTVAIDQLAQILTKYDLSEVEIDLGDLHVRIARERASLAPPPPRASSHTPTSIAATAASDSADERLVEPAIADLPGAVKSPMVGTAYLRQSPEAKPFVEVGSVVKIGDKLLLVAHEALGDRARDPTGGPHVPREPVGDAAGVVDRGTIVIAAPALTAAIVASFTNSRRVISRFWFIDPPNVWSACTAHSY